MNSSNSIKFKYQCCICEKNYIRKSSLERHQILCEFLTKTKREKDILLEEEKDMPTYIELVGIVKELSIKYIGLQEKIENMEKWVDKKKKKINVIDWLTNNRIPPISFKEWIDGLSVLENDIEYLMQNNIFNTENHSIFNSNRAILLIINSLI